MNGTASLRNRSRITLWEGYVLTIDPDSLWIRLALISPKLQNMHEVVIDAEFPPTALSRADAADVREGSYVTLYIHRRGRKTRTVLRLKRFRPWTEAELVDIRKRAADRATLLATWAEE